MNDKGGLFHIPQGKTKWGWHSGFVLTTSLWHTCGIAILE